jgi:hypothetical protein
MPGVTECFPHNIMQKKQYFRASFGRSLVQKIRNSTVNRGLSAGMLKNRALERALFSLPFLEGLEKGKEQEGRG